MMILFLKLKEKKNYLNPGGLDTNDNLMPCVASALVLQMSSTKSLLANAAFNSFLFLSSNSSFELLLARISTLSNATSGTSKYSLENDDFG